jgi:hypothetical protein
MERKKIQLKKNVVIKKSLNNPVKKNTNKKKFK